MTPALTIPITAVLTSLVTWGLAALWVRRILAPRLEQAADQRTESAAERIRAEVRAGALEALAESGLMEAIRGIGDDVRDGVLRGVQEADLDGRLEDLEQEISRRVKKGVVDGFTSVASADALRETTLSVTETSANLVSDGLSGLLSGLAKSIVPDDREPPKT